MAKNDQFGKYIVNSHSKPLESTSLRADYYLEEERLKSFANWPVENPIAPARLAKSGFYYSGKEDEVICFSCLGHIKDWNYGDIVQKKHCELFPNCDFVNGRSKNVPIIETRNQKSNIHYNVNQKPSNSKSSSQLFKIMRGIDYNKMKSKTVRLKSFENAWPLSNNIVNLAEAGFFYLGIADYVQCAFCKGLIKDWDCDDDPFDMHRKYYPYCSYINERKNAPLEKKLLKNKTLPKWYQAGFDVCGNMTSNVNSVTESSGLYDTHKVTDPGSIHTNLIKLGVKPYTSPIYPEQASLNARLRTFDSWPGSVDIPIRKLVEAGFFYTGFSDHTKCFHCGGGLCHWEDDDNPWYEHARWFCNCPFLQMHKDNEFITKCYEAHGSAKGNQLSDSPPAENPMIQLDEAMKSDIIKKCLDSGLFPPYVVRASVLRQIKEDGQMFTDLNELCLAATYIKEEMEKMPLESYNTDGLDLDNIEVRPNYCSDEIQDNPLVTNDHPPREKISTNSTCSNGLDRLENDKIVKSESTRDQCLCKICMDKDVGIVFLPCGHLLACIECASSLNLCPLCRKSIKATVKVYLP